MGDSYGRSYNPVRNRLGQPIIETYFVPKKTSDYGLRVWITPESLKANKFHLSKAYRLDLLGNIRDETDHYHPAFDTESIRLLNFDTLEYETLNRRSTPKYPQQILTRYYLFRNDSARYECSIYIDDKRVLVKVLNRKVGDSILRAFEHK